MPRLLTNEQPFDLLDLVMNISELLYWIESLQLVLLVEILYEQKQCVFVGFAQLFRLIVGNSIRKTYAKNVF